MIVYSGQTLTIKIKGSSHSPKIDFTIDGFPAGLALNQEEIRRQLDRRSAFTKDYATPRKERDQYMISSGLENGKTTDLPIKGYFLNENTQSKDYDQFKKIPRPSHVDYVLLQTEGEQANLAGGKNFSGRMTLPLVFAGAIAKDLLAKKDIHIGSHFLELYRIKDAHFDPVNLRKHNLEALSDQLPFIDKENESKLKDQVAAFKQSKDSFGGIVEVAILGDLNFLGGPYFKRLQSSLAKMLLAIPGTKGISFGNGFDATKLKGSENNDVFILENQVIKTKTNRAGGLNGGVANGMPILFDLAFKPTSSIGQAQTSLNLESKEQENLLIEGRHDPAFILRTPAIVENMTALVLYDLLVSQEDKSLREKIDQVDRQLIDLYLERMAITDQVALVKAKNKMAVEDKLREGHIMDHFSRKYPDYSKEITDLYQSIFRSSKARQENILRKQKAAYGLIGRTLSYSYSKEIHERYADYIYELIELRPEELASFLERPALKGLNVTIPYKKAVIPMLDELTYEAKKIGAVNVIKFLDDKKIGYNTDFYGFKKLLINQGIYVKDKKVLVLGTGASAQTIEAVLKNMGAKAISFVSRNGPLNYDNLYERKDYEVLVNTTPVGMTPNTEQLLVDLDRLPSLKYVADINYNPLYSRLVVEAKKRGLVAAGGLDMLIYQAKKAVEIFTDKKIYQKEAHKVRNDIFASKMNIVLVGMPGSGKTTIGRQLATKLNKKHVDLDEEFFNLHGVRPSQVIEEDGEDKMREMESEVVKKFGMMNNLVISTGGGVVTRHDNYYHLKQNALIIQIDRSVYKLSTKNRPLSQGGVRHLFKMHENRKKSYAMFSDVTVKNDGYFKYAVEDILELIKKEINHM